MSRQKQQQQQPNRNRISLKYSHYDVAILGALRFIVTYKKFNKKGRWEDKQHEPIQMVRLYFSD